MRPNDEPCAWSVAVAFPKPEPNAVQVWRVPLDVGPEHVRRLTDWLSPEERARAGRFHFERDSDRFIVGRGALRQVLASCMGLAPGMVELRAGPTGKPALGGDQRRSGLRFNLAHSHGLALLALALHREVGVDLERIRPIVDLDSISANFFTPGEARALNSISTGERLAAFFRCWTRKEAYLKARGAGLTIPLDSFEVALAAGDPPALLATRPDPADAGRWTLVDLDAGPGYTAALAVEGMDWRLQCWQWEPA